MLKIHQHCPDDGMIVVGVGAAWNNKTIDKEWDPDTERTKRLFLLQWDKVAACPPPPDILFLKSMNHTQ